MATATRTTEIAALDALGARALELVQRTREHLEHDDASPIPPEALTRELAEASEALHAAVRGPAIAAADRAATLCTILAQLTSMQGELSEHVIEQRFRTLARIHGGLSRLRDQPTVAELLPAAAEELCRCCDFDRAVISRVQGSEWTPEVVFITPGQDAEVTRTTKAFLLTEGPMPLGPGMLETQLVRRRTAAVVSDPEGDPRVLQELIHASSSPGYAAAPVMPTGRVIGFLHADCFGTGRELGAPDRDNIWTFAEGFGLIFERLILFERLQEQRERAREAFAAAEAQIDELCSGEVELARQEREASTTATTAAAIFAVPSLSTVERLLTGREREVMALMITGARNREIADRLVITPETVKSHVKKIRRKLRASNRADAVSRYLQLTMKARA